ncbi:MAG: recombination protein RecR [Acidobacteria bacterium]|nr:recombination protein RecR [Acidobacteriota bacterium]
MTIDYLERATELLAKMPGVGRKSAQRMAFRIIALPSEYALELAEAIRALKEELKVCEQCFNFSASTLCGICSDAKRDPRLICVVEDASSIKNIERSGRFRGLYHVLQGVLSPMHGVGPDDLRCRELLLRVASAPIDEVIFALNPTLEGEATSAYLGELLKGSSCTLSRIATGIPVGGSLDYCDEITMASAIDHRRNF